jgi:D-ribulokinase
MQQRAFIGVDVGTGSARAGVFDGTGRLLGTARHPIRIWRDAGDIVEQSSDDIWAACAEAVRGAVARAGVEPDAVAGIGFDATCSLVALDDAFRPVSVSPSGDPARNIVVWMDHRAIEETNRINATGHRVLRHVGGRISPEMQTPKLLWLKNHLPDAYARARHFLDLSDFLTARATGDLARSTCTVTCKWTYLAHERQWDDGYFRAIGLEDHVEDGYARIGRRIVDPGTPLGSGLSESAAADFGLRPGIPVGAALIDAHAGGIGTIGGRTLDGGLSDPARRLALIMGTSTCAMAVSGEERFVGGVWGPYYSAMVPGYWLAEGGQSAAGAAIDHIVALHPAYPALRTEADGLGTGVFELLERDLANSVPALAEAAFLARDIHVLPDLLGNRSPFADPDARGMVAGLTLDASRDGLARLYVAVLCALGYGTAQILEALEASGYAIDTVVISGGAGQSALVRQIMADATGRRVALPETPEPVLLGAAMLGAMASGAFASVDAAMAAFSRTGEETRPAGGGVAGFHAAKRQAFETIQRVEAEIRQIMSRGAT